MLETYRKKRDFTATAEPRGKKNRVRNGDRFVVQKHAARRLHYDFRLEMDGVLKSWAVTRGPSLVPGEKRLAVHVEDHPLEYGDFEGTIPKGEYGGGTVIVWDRGRWKPIGDPHKGYAKGHLEFELEGEKLHGRWHLVRMAKKPREKRENWLLIKGDDEAARTAGESDILAERPESVKTGRGVDQVAGEQPGWSSKTGQIERVSESDDAERPDVSKLRGARKAVLPNFLEPSLATLVGKAPSGNRWLHEIKFDGYRLQARIEAGRVKLLTRSGLDWTTKFGKDLARTAACATPRSAAYARTRRLTTSRGNPRGRRSRPHPAPLRSSPIPTASIGPMRASRRRGWRSTMPRSGGTLHPSSWPGRWRWCGARKASPANASFRSTPGRDRAAASRSPAIRRIPKRSCSPSTISTA
jgi:DNA ligase D-like protein (predicted 3'-phosphoesterase)